MDRGTRWLYEACFFSAAVQSEPQPDGGVAPEGNPNRVNLGTWKGFAQDFSFALFDNGHPCQNVGLVPEPGGGHDQRRCSRGEGAAWRRPGSSPGARLEPWGLVAWQSRRP